MVCGITVIVGSDHQHHQIGGVGAAGAHLGERGVARRIDEGDLVTGPASVT